MRTALVCGFLSNKIEGILLPREREKGWLLFVVLRLMRESAHQTV